MASIVWDQEVAEVYDAVYAVKHKPGVVDPIIGLLTSLAGGGPVLEFAAGTGRVALPLSARGLAVSGIELSPHMAERMRAKPGADAVPVVVGDMTTTRVPGSFALVGRLVASLDGGRRPPGQALRAVPLRLAVRARPDGQARRVPPRAPLVRLGAVSVHVRQQVSGRRLPEGLGPVPDPAPRGLPRVALPRVACWRAPG